MGLIYIFIRKFINVCSNMGIAKIFATYIYILMEQGIACLIHNLRMHGSSPVNYKNQKLIKIQPY